MTPGKKFLQALESEHPLQIAGTVNAYCALLAQQAGFKCLYLSGAGVANASLAKADLGLTRLDDVLEDARRITSACTLPLLVDVDTGFSDEISLQQMSQKMIQAGVAAIQIEDQVSAKRCGHRPGKSLVSSEQMQQRIIAARQDIKGNELLIMARTDAYSVEGLDAAISRGIDYEACGADLLFIESPTSLQDYQQFSAAIKIPILANITEFGLTPLFNIDELKDAGVSMALYPLSAFRAMNKAALEVYQTIKQQGTQSSLLEKMQTRNELYATLDYLTQEKKQR
ncbi:Methylisocitrate lyase [hydrothermal vent metagenome]|uniref:Methylisocitrate lyase n=1 Tax=hydrothermal vent metagenome TaxID=652676 RepID=A0A3B0X6E2_9ZZZZ